MNLSPWQVLSPSFHAFFLCYRYSFKNSNSTFRYRYNNLFSFLGSLPLNGPCCNIGCKPTHMCVASLPLNRVRLISKQTYAGLCCKWVSPAFVNRSSCKSCILSYMKGISGLESCTPSLLIGWPTCVTAAQRN